MDPKSVAKNIGGQIMGFDGSKRKCYKVVYEMMAANAPRDPELVGQLERLVQNPEYLDDFWRFCCLVLEGEPSAARLDGAVEPMSDEKLKHLANTSRSALYGLFRDLEQAEVSQQAWRGLVDAFEDASRMYKAPHIVSISGDNISMFHLWLRVLQTLPERYTSEV